jgi:hypothetical protein
VVVGSAAVAAQGPGAIPVVIPPTASQVERLAADELAHHLQLIYPSYRFPISTAAPPAGTYILLGTVDSFPELRRNVSIERSGPRESFAVTTYHDGMRSLGVIAGADPPATLFAVYALLERLGYGFYLSYTTQPEPKREPFEFDAWRLSDAALVTERVVFTWHNFLSGCSTWELEDWKLWIVQVSRMRFNTIMVHAYGNNPMFSFTHHGQSKPVGFLTTTRKGRDWGTEHVNDVRRIIGGQGIFKSSVFGSSAALVPDEERVAAATSLMQQVFAFARSRGLRVTLALDVDTESSNPQNVIETLPPSARFASGTFQLADPASAEGYGYYKSLITQLMRIYPEINQIALWMRGRPGDSLWRSLEPTDFPISWNDGYQQALRRFPELQQDPESPSLYALSKVASAFRKALAELDLNSVELALGSWRFGYLPAADRLMPSEVKLIPLDYEIKFESDEVQNGIQAVSAGRKVVPVVWAQHDDHSYVGKPYTPFANFASLLQTSRSAGYGIIHWTTRPLDLYFKSLSEQVWSDTKNQALEVTCRQMAERTFRVPATSTGARFLLQWINGAPMFGEETTDRFMGRPVEDSEQIVARCRSRLEILEALRKESHSTESIERIRYFEDLEHFFVMFYQTQAAWQESLNRLQHGEIAAARQAALAYDPLAVLLQYAQAVSRGRITRGEMGILISMNLRWLPYILSQRQALGLDAVRYKFGPTQHEPLAQGAGSNTFYFDSRHEVWKALGGKETGVDAVQAAWDASLKPTGEEVLFQSGIEGNTQISLCLNCIGDQPLLPGTYNVDVLFASPSRTTRGSCVFEVELSGSPQASAISDRIDFVERSRAGRSLQVSYPVRVEQGFLSLRVRPLQGRAMLCGLRLKPANSTV